MKLQGQARTLLFDQYIGKESISHDKLFRFTLISKSNASIVRQFFNGSTIKYGWNEFRIAYKEFDGELFISIEVLSTFLKLFRPQQLELRIYWNYNLYTLKRLVPYLDGVTKLYLDEYGQNVIPFLYCLLPQLDELECNVDCLMPPNLPVLNLNKLTIFISMGNYPDKISRIFRHNIKILDLQIEDVQGSFINKSNSGQASVEHLIFRVEYASLVEIVLPIFTNYCENLPKLETINIKITRDPSYMQNKLFGRKFAAMCDEIVLFKNRVKNLTINLSNTIRIPKFAEFESEWELILSKVAQFGDLHIEQKDNEERIQFEYTENFNGMFFKLDAEVRLRIDEE